jgi:hypothetical protein
MLWSFVFIFNEEKAMSDILLHHTKLHQQAQLLRKSLKPLPNSVVQGVHQAKKLINSIKNTSA